MTRISWKTVPGDLGQVGLRSLAASASRPGADAVIGVARSHTASMAAYDATVRGTRIAEDADGSVSGLALTPASETTPGTINLSGTELAFTTATTLDNLIINMANFATLADYSTGLTLGSRATIQQVAGGSNPFVKIDIVHRVVNLGTINAGLEDHGIRIESFYDGATFINRGLINVANDGSFYDEMPVFTNAGTINVTNGGFLSLSKAWSNIGKINVIASIINLQGSFKGSSLAGLTLSSAKARLLGAADNAGNTLTIGEGTALSGLIVTSEGTLYNGTIHGGVVQDSGGGLVFTGGSLDGVTYRGTLDLTNDHGALYAANGLTFGGLYGAGAGLLRLTGTASSLHVMTSTSLDNVAINFANNSAMYNDASAGTLTLGSHVTIANVAGLGSGAIIDSHKTGTLNSLATITSGLTNNAFFVLQFLQFANGGLIAVANGGTFYELATTFRNDGTINVTAGGSLYLGGNWSNRGRINATGSTLDLGGTFDTSALAAMTLEASTTRISGRLVNTGRTLDVGKFTASGSLILAEGYSFNIPTIVGGVIQDSAGAFSLQRGTLDGVTYRGTLNVGPGEISVTNGLAITGASGTGTGTINMTGPTSLMDVTTTATLDNATVNLDNYSVILLDVDDGTLTLGSRLLVRTSGAASSASISHATGTGTLVNRGSINVDAGSTLYINGFGSFANDGVIDVANGGFLYENVTISSNSGTTSVTTGGTVYLGPEWSDDGKLMVTGATLGLFGNFALADLSKMSLSSASLDIVGQLTNSGTTISLDRGGALAAFNLTQSGRIVGGVVLPGSGRPRFSGGILDGVTYRGVLDLSAAGSSVSIIDGITLAAASGAGPGAVTVGNYAANALATLDVFGNTTLDHGTITLSAGTLDVAATGAVPVLTLGPSLTLQDAGFGYVYTSTPGGTIVNAGRILATTGGGDFVFSHVGFTNRGAILVSNGDVLEFAFCNLTNLSAGTLSGGSYTVGGGSTLRVYGATPITILAATVALAGVGSVFNILPQGGAIFVDLSTSLTRIAAAGSLSLLSGRVFDADNAVTVDGVLTLRAGTYGAAKGLTIGVNGTLAGTGSVTAPVYNTGAITAAGGTLALTGAVFGYGALAATLGGVLQLAQAPLTTLSGKITLDGVGSAIRFVSAMGTTDLAASLTSIGVHGSLLVLGGRGYAAKGVLADQGFLNLQGGSLSAGKLSVAAGAKLLGFGAVTSPVSNNGTIEAYGGVLKLGLVQGTGGLRIDAASTLELAGAVSQGVTFAAGGIGTLQLDTPAAFSGAIGGMALGDVIAFGNQTVASAIVGGGTLTVTGSAGTVKYQVSGALAGNHFAVQADHHSITLIAGVMSAARADLLPAATPAEAWTRSPDVAPGAERYKPSHPPPQLVHS